jgi:Dyp-type peroxidase family
MILRGLGALKASRYLTLRIDNVAGARAWLREIADELTSAAVPVTATDRHLNIAFTCSGLTRLGLPETTLAGFRSAFLEGAAGAGESPSPRSRALGDVDESAPERWHWGNAARPIDVALLLFASDSVRIVEFARFHRDRLAKQGLTVVDEFDTGELPKRREHFGFRDGIAQPLLRNTNAAGERPGVLEKGRPENTVEPGEFLFGYRNEYGAVPSVPGVLAALDPAGNLPSFPGSLERDFARNGSFLVWRQLEEHVQDFWRAIRDNAENKPDARRMLAAKFFGRWPSGAPLALAPEIEDESLEDANDFSFANDPYGYRTPFGAHIRRGNPRDWHLSPKPELSRGIANKHRIIRRGRPYGPPVKDSMDPEDILAANEDSQKRGVHFLCFMADIERQFEMIQSTWLNDEKFGGLYDEVDPMLGAQPPAGGGFTLQATPMRRRLVGLSRFVTVRGAAYLFMPSLRAVRFLGELKGEPAS